MVTLWIYGGGDLGRVLSDLFDASGARTHCSPGSAPGQPADDHAAREAARVLERYGALDALVYLVEDIPPGTPVVPAVQQVAGDFLACAREAVRAMATRRVPGNLVCICDNAGVAGRPGCAAAATAAGAVLGMVRALAKELGRQGIAVNALACGRIGDPHDGTVTGAGPGITEAQTQLLAGMGLGQALRPQELATTLSLLVGGGHGLTGQVLHVDHGFII